jgi:NTP pyrophosphatase (non-canonical NTP hydrolase)
MGQDLVDALVKYSGLPSDYAQRRILELIAAHKKDLSALNLEDIREIAADLLQDIILHANHNDHYE